MAPADFVDWQRESKTFEAFTAYVDPEKVVDPTTGQGTWRYYTVQVASQRFHLYRSLQLFYANGGESCFVVSAGTTAAQKPVAKQALLDGLAALAEQVGPTMVVVPDATLLPSDSGGKPWESADFQAVEQAMLAQGGKFQDRFAILDVYGTPEVTAANLEAVIASFRAAVGQDNLSYGATYFPFLDTLVVSAAEVDYASIDIADAAQLALLQQILGWENLTLHGDPASGSKLSPQGVQVQAEIDAISATDPPATLQTRNQNLTAALPLLQTIENVILRRENRLPPCGGKRGTGKRGTQMLERRIMVPTVDPGNEGFFREGWSLVGGRAGKPGPYGPPIQSRPSGQTR